MVKKHLLFGLVIEKDGGMPWLGITFDTDLTNMTQINFTNAFESMHTTIDILSKNVRCLDW